MLIRLNIARVTIAAMLVALSTVLAAGAAQAPASPAETATALQNPAPTANPGVPPNPRGTNAPNALPREEEPVANGWEAQYNSVSHALVRLPLAALLSATLAFRPRRRGTPPRQASVIQTQVILAIVGAVVMLVVGQSLARAFGIVGAAGLIRYRAKVDDPKDAGVMLSTLAVGLASGVGLYLLAGFATVFVGGVLWLIESIDPEPYKLFSLTLTADKSEDLKDPVEGVLRQRHIPFELRSISPEELCYELKLPLTVKTDKVSEALIALRPKEAIDVKWEQQKDKK